jgi:hypothetical protein
MRYKEHYGLPGDSERKWEDKMHLQSLFDNTITTKFNKMASEKEDLRIKTNEALHSIQR